MKKQLALIPSILFPLFVLSSCGGSSDDDGSIDSTGSQVDDTASSDDEGADLDSEPVTGLVRVRNNFDNFVTPSAVFGLTDEQDLFGTLERLSETDACRLSGELNSTILLTNGFSFNLSEVDFDLPTVPAGDEIIINTGGSPIGLVDDTNDVPGEEQVFYGTSFFQGPIAGPLPDGVTVTIPGSSVVPSFTDEAIPNIDEVVVLNSEFTTLDINAGLQWEAPTNAVENARMTVEAAIFLAEPTPAIAFPGINFLQCVLEDDGEFMFPEELTPFVDQQFVDTITFTRSTWRTEQNGNTTLILLNETANMPVIPDLF